MTALWKVEQFGDGPCGGIIRAATSAEALLIWRKHLEGYEDCYQTTGTQRITRIPDDEDIVYVALRPI